MIDPRSTTTAIVDAGITSWYGVPDSLLATLLTAMSQERGLNVTTTANEGSAIAAAAGSFLATGTVPGVYMQNSGLGNALNPLISITHQAVYSIPMILLIGWRGYPGTTDEPQHVAQGEATTALLSAASVPFVEMPTTDDHVLSVFRDALADAALDRSPVAILVPPDRLEKPQIRPGRSPEKPTRESVITTVLDVIPTYSMVLATTGKTGRELHELRVSRSENPMYDFLNVGGMGHAISVALGIATSVPNTPVVVLDGDGSSVMHLGAQTTVANVAPRNLIHLVLNNGAHESVGGQPTHLERSSIAGIALAAGYQSAVAATSLVAVANALKAALAARGPHMIEVDVGLGSRSNLGRPPGTRTESRDMIRKKFS